jgi:hypothetical protein
MSGTRIFGREPTLWLQAISAGLSVFVAIGIPGTSMTADQQAAVIAFISALIGVLNALAVRPWAPGLFAGLVGAGAALAARFGFEASPELVAALQGALVVTLGLVARNQVTPTADPQPLDRI